LSAFNVATAAETLKRLKYSGPVALSWDDTALEACISVYQESKDVCLIVGGADGAIRVTEDDDLDALFEAAKLKKADKVQITTFMWTQISLIFCVASGMDPVHPSPQNTSHSCCCHGTGILHQSRGPVSHAPAVGAAAP
jgi:hypothetical protein